MSQTAVPSAVPPAGYALLLCVAGALHGCAGTQNLNNGQSSTHAGSRGATGKPGTTASTQTNGSGGSQAVVDRAAARPALEAWAKAFSDWAGGTRAPQATTATARPQRKAVYVDVMAVARRHPAWQLAAALERNGAPVRLANVRAMAHLQTFGALSGPLASSGGFDSHWANIPGAPFSSPEYSRVPATPGSLPPAPFTQQAAQRVTASGLNALQEYSRQRQRLAIENFLQVDEQRSEIEIENHAADLRGALEENIAAEVQALQRRALAPAAPTLPPPAVQLEMTNLRLRLQNARLSEAERGQAQSRLNTLEAQWREELRAQENAQLAQLEQSRRELPLQRRREGTGPINQMLAQLRSAGESEREEVRARSLSLLRQDFGQDDAALGIVLPALVSPFEAFPAIPSTSSTRIARSRTVRSGVVRSGVVPGRGFFETPSLGVASNAEINTGSLLQPLRLQPGSRRGGSAISGFPVAQNALAQRTAQISALRAQAIREARLWTRIVARRQGWQLQEMRAARTQQQSASWATPRTTPPPTDGTSTVLKILNFA